jgi:PAS domain S-box-containing protein
MSLWDWLLNPAGLTAHGFCLSWAPGLVSLHAGSDAVVGLAYFSIPLALASLAEQRKDLRYSWMLYLFVAFILACGTTHLMSILTLWVPAYGIEGLIKLVTAVLSIGTAAILWPLIPRLVALPSPAQLERLNGELSATIAEQEKTAALLRDSEARGRTANIELERQVAEQTAELRSANARLTEALAQRTTALQALAISEEEFRASFEAAAVGKAQVEPATARILRANSAFAHMLGYEPADLVGRIAWEITWPEDRADDQAEYARFLSGEVTAYVREKRYLRRDGTPIWGRISGTLIRSSETGRPTLMVAVIEDVDERHKAQMALQAATRDLEAVVEERTAALQQRDILLREVYHRVKNNLQLIDSLLVMQARQLADPEAKTALLGLRRRVYALGLVHHQLMNSTNLRTFDVAPFLQELSANIIEGAVDRNILLSVHAIPLDVGLDFAIPLGLMVTELVTNALKHAFPHGVGTIAVILERRPDDEVALIVSDDGQGQDESKTSAGRPRAGMGINIVTTLVAQLQGTMTVQKGNGTRTEIRVAAPVLS